MKFLKGQSADGKLPSMKLLKAEKEKLLQQKKEAQKTYHYYRDYQKEVATARFIHSEMSLRLSFMVCCYQKHLSPALSDISVLPEDMVCSRFSFLAAPSDPNPHNALHMLFQSPGFRFC